MSEQRYSLRRAATLMVGGVLLASALMSVLIAAVLYQTTFERSARDRSATIARDYEEKLITIEREWDEHLMREKTRLEFSRLLQDPVDRWDRLRAYLAALSDSPLYAGLALCDVKGRLLFREGPATACQGPENEGTAGRVHHYVQDESDNLFIELDAPIWLGPEGMGTMHLAMPLDHSFLRELAFPDAELFIEWQGRIVASSAGESGIGRGRPGFGGRIDRGGERYEQRQIFFPASSTPPILLIQTRIQPPFSVAESAVMAAGVFALLALLLMLALRGWLTRLLPRIEKLGQAALSYAADGKPSPAIDAVLEHAAGPRLDELSDVARAVQDMFAALALRERERDGAETRLRESEQRFRDVAEFSGEFVWEVDRKQTLVFVSDGAAAVFGRPVAELIGSHVLEYLPAAERGPFMERVSRLAAAGEPFRRFEVTILRPDGGQRLLAFSGTPVVGANGQRTGSYRGMVVDITQQQRDQENLRLAEKVFDHSAQAILITDASGCIVAVNPAFSEITGYRADEAIGEKPAKFASGRHDAGFYAEMWGALERSGAWAGEVWDRRKNGEVFPKWLTVNAVQDPETRVVTHYVGIFSDITEQKENEARIAQLAYHDPLTGLPNRYALNAHLTQSLADARRNGTKLAVMFIDLDRFKTINDSLGHNVGDRLLITVARRIRAVLRESDTVARVGGDEFVVVVPDIVGPEDAARVAEKIISGMGEQLVLAGHPLHVSPSIGIAICPTDGHEAETLMKNADSAMYYAKQHGRNSYHFFTADMNAAATERLLLETQLHHALDRREFEVVYQPQVEIGTGRVVGVEALLRWQHPDRGEIQPEQFIPLAEDIGLIVPLGTWILEEACRQAVSWDADAATLRISVNLSVRQLKNRHLVEDIAEILADTGLSADRLELEITESAVMADPEAAIELLRSLAALGVRLAIDDFGTGYSSLTYLKRLPSSRLKIDRSFVKDLETDPNDAAITEAIIALAGSLGLAVTAEGIETAAQLEMLKNFGCAEGQGFLFSGPLNADALREFLGRTPPFLLVDEPAGASAGRQLH